MNSQSHQKLAPEIILFSKIFNQILLIEFVLPYIAKKVIDCLCIDFTLIPF